MLIKDSTYLDFDDVLLLPHRSQLKSRKDVDLNRQFTTLHGYMFQGTPIIASNMLCGNFKMLETLENYYMFTAIAKHHTQEWFTHFENRRQNPNCQTTFYRAIRQGFFTIGMSEDEKNNLLKFYNLLKETDEAYCGYPLHENLKICIDIANGYTQKFSDYVRSIRELFPKNFIIAGNVATPEMCSELIVAGADCIKVGIGSSKFCRTRAATGVGVPQFSALIECADVVHGLRGLIISDGGCKTPGDVAKAFCANADFVMLGTMFAGTDECDGDEIEKYIHDGTYRRVDNVGGWYDNLPNVKTKKYKTFYGMSSWEAQKKHGEKKDYRTSEGYVEEVECKGPVKNVVDDILGGLRSTGTYIGADKIRYFGRCATFIRVQRTHSR